MGKTIDEFIVTMFPSKKKFFCQLSGMEVGASLLGGEFECARVNSLPELRNPNFLVFGLLV